jgi:hypothetical protein
MAEIVSPTQLRIVEIRDRQVVLDSDLANLYEVETKVLLQQVRRNAGRFPDDFMFQLSQAEWEALKSQNVTSKPGRGGRRSRPFVFTEHGVAMLSSVLRSERAIAVNIEVVRAFVAMRRHTQGSEELARRIDELEGQTVARLDTHEEHLAEIFAALRRMASPPPKRKHPVGFRLRD